MLRPLNSNEVIDTHCHIDDEQFLSELDAVIRRQQEGGVEAIVVPGVNKASVQTVLEVCSRYPGYLYPALGLHPEDVRADYKEVLAFIHEALLSSPFRGNEGGFGFVAIGEIGLDYHWSTEFKPEQQDALRIQLGWAADMDLPVIIHARDAAEDTLRLIRDFNHELVAAGRKPLRGVMHCFSGSYEIAQEYLKMGWYLGIGGVLTFKNCKLGETLVPKDGRPQIPLERLVLETDAPYMAPVPHRGEANESRWMSYVADKLAELYKTDQKTVIETTNLASKQLFCIN